MRVLTFKVLLWSNCLAENKFETEKSWRPPLYNEELSWNRDKGIGLWLQRKGLLLIEC